MADWNKLSRTGNVVDRRGMRGGGIGLFGTIAVLGIGMLLGVDPMQLLGEVEQIVPQETSEQSQEFAGNDSYEDFSKRVMGSLDGYWEQHVEGYAPATLVLFRDRTTSGCGGASSFSGPHYCPLDSQIYLDERFFEDLESEFGARGGDVAEAYVIAHEAGHHLQNQLGLLDGSDSAAASVATELTADCLAGAWLGSLQSEGIFAEDEVLEAVDAAGAVGDDNIQRRTEGTVHPETWTHGSSAERKDAVMRGFRGFADPSVCLGEA